MVVIAIILGVIGLVSSLMVSSQSGDELKLDTERVGVLKIINAHQQWKEQLIMSALSGEPFTGSLNPNTCSLGAWLSDDVAKNIDDPEVLSLLGKVAEPHARIHNEAGIINELISDGDKEGAIEHMTTQVLPNTQEVISLLTSAQDRYSNLLDEKSMDTSNLEVSLRYVILLFILISAAVGILLAWKLTTYVVTPLSLMTNFMIKASTNGDISLSQDDIKVITKMSSEKDELADLITSTAAFIKRVTAVGDVLCEVSEGNLTNDFELLSEEDVIGTSLKTMLGNLNHMLNEIDSAAVQVSTGAGQIANAAQTLAQGATEQASTVNSLSSAIHDISDETKQKAETGTEKMVQMVKSVADINDASNEIRKIIKVIDDIAFQTNILALNASVEAARAGNQGKGFAVVAEEVKNLANRSQAAASETNNLIANSLKLAENGANIAHETQAALESIVNTIDKLEGAAVGIKQISAVVQQNSATAQESAAASEELSSQSGAVRHVIGQFKLREDVFGGGSRIQKRLGSPKYPISA